MWAVTPPYARAVLGAVAGRGTGLLSHVVSYLSASQFPHLQNGNGDSISLPGACDDHMIKMENTSRLVPAQSSNGLSLYYEGDY